MVLVKQFRAPIAQFFTETPAGMLDESGNFVGTAAQEVHEETGIEIQYDELIPLGNMFPSPGGSDEEIIMYGIEKNLT